MITQNLSTLKIHKLTQEQYDRELAAGRIDENALYLTPDEEIDLTPYATKEEVATKADAGHSHEISDVTDLQSTLDVMEDELRGYTDTKIADLINGAPTTLNTLGEIADAMEENADVVEALHNAVGAKANVSDLTAHSGNKENPHEVTAEQLGLGNVENKSSAMIREEITAEDVSNALGFEPADVEEVSIQLEATNNMLPLVVEMITTTVDGQSTYSLADGWTYATLKEQWDTGRMVCLRNGSAVYHLSDSSSTRLLFYKLSIFNYTSGAVGITGYLVYPDGRVLATTSSWYQPKYYQIGYYSGEWKFTSTSTTYSTILTYINYSNTVVCLYRSLNDGTRQVYYFNRKVVLSDGSVELYFYCIMGTQLYQHIIRSDNTMSNGYYQLVTGNNTINGKQLFTNPVLTPADIGAAGRSVTGTVYTIDGIEYTADAGAEVFNNCGTNKAIGFASHAEGSDTTASGVCSHAEGMSTRASGYESHAEGYGTIAGSLAQHAQGRYNIEDSNNIYAHIVGNGYSSADRSNAHTLDWDGNAWYAGDIKIGGSSYDDADAKTVSTTDHRHSWNELKNRPFYESDSCTVGSYLGGYIQAGSNGIKTARLYDVDLTMLEPGATYHITFLEQDSPYAEIASYDWTVKEWDSTSNDPYYVGNPIIYADSGSLGEDSGEPAVLYTRDGAAYMAIDTRREPLTVITGLLNVVISKDAGLKTIDEKYIPDSIARTGHTHNWMDVGSKAYECNGYVIIEPTTFESNGDYMENVFNTFEIINGEVYTVLFDGIEYTTTAVDDGIDITDVFGVGNGYDNTNYTYCAAGTHTVSIYKGYVQATICEDVIIYPYDNYDDIEWFETDVLMSDGETYVVTWDDVEYICLARRDGESVFIGRQSLMKEHGYSGNLPDIGNEPFVIYTTDSGDLGVLRNNQSHTVTVKRATKRVDYSMPVKYLPTHTHTIEDVFELGVNKEIMLEESTATLSSGDLEQYSDWMEISVLPSHGDICIVTWQGEEYETVAYLEEDRGRIYVGNRHFYSDAEDTGEPFLFLIDAEDYEYRIITHDELTECTYKAWVQRKAIHPNYIPDTIARISDLAQSDWSINDPSNPAYIHNRPFYTTDPTNITLLSGTYSFRQAGDTLYTAQLGTMSQVVAEGQTLSITYDESVYDVVVKTATIDSVTYLCAGNVSILNSIFGTSFTNTNEPFVFIFSNTTSVLYTSAVPSNTAVTIGTITSEIITIPHEYLGLNVDNGAGDYAVVEGFNTTADGQYAHAEGAFTEASGLAAHAEGSSTRATGVTAHAEGTGSVASGDYSHAEGNTTQATKAYAHSEGYYTEATGEYGAHAEGYFAVASGDTSHAEGSHTQAKGSHSHAEGFRTIAAGEHQHVEGQYNIEDTENKYIHIAGNGSKDGPVRSNAHTLDWDGNAWFKGDVKVGGTGYDDATNTLATETYVDEAVAEKVTKTSLTLSLPIASWSNNSITVTATGATADNTIFVAPAPASQTDYTSAGVMCTAQAANSLTFTCTSAPTADLSVNVVIFD